MTIATNPFDISPIYNRKETSATLGEDVFRFSPNTEADLIEFLGNKPPEDLLIIQGEDEDHIVHEAVLIGESDKFPLKVDEYNLFGTNCAKEAILIGNAFYDHKARQIIEETKENDEIVHKLSRINAFRQRLYQLKENVPEGKNIVFDNRPEDKKLIDDLLEIEECKDLFKKGEYTFKNKNGSLETLDRELVNTAKGISSPHVNFILMRMQENFNERNRVMEIVMEIVRQYNSSIHVFIQNFSRRNS